MMLRKVARPLLATWFIHDGYNAVRHPSEHVEAAREPLAKATGLIGMDPLDDKTVKRIVQFQGAATVALGGALALSKTPRTAGLLLALSTVPQVAVRAPRSVADLRSPQVTGPFVSKLGALGAALLVAADTAGQPSMAWRVQKARTERREVAAAASATKA